MTVPSLTFAALDGIAFAARRARLNELPGGTVYGARALGPFMEWRQLSASGLLPHPDKAEWLQLGPFSAFTTALRSGERQWIGDGSRVVGFFRIGADWSEDDTPLVGFGLAAQKSAAAMGFHRSVAAQFAAAIVEMVSNVHEHSGKSGTGIVAFGVGDGEFEFVVADQGMGVLESLRSGPEYKSLADHGDALRLALTDGISRFGKDSGRGKGFRPIFVGLANLSGALRFRSGDHALLIDGQNIDAVNFKAAQKVPLKGFLISVTCKMPVTR